MPEHAGAFPQARSSCLVVSVCGDQQMKVWGGAREGGENLFGASEAEGICCEKHSKAAAGRARVRRPARSRDWSFFGKPEGDESGLSRTRKQVFGS